MERAALNREGVARSQQAAIGTVVCVETHDDEQTVPWVIGSLLESISNAPAASPPFDPNKDAVHFEPVKVNEPALK
eukprot:381939-Prymnesium_polylepis.1